MNNSILKGSILVALGASSYGMLTTFVKMAYAEGYTSYEITFSQMLLGLIGLIIINLLFVREKQVYTEETKTKSILKLMAGNFFGINKYLLLYLRKIYSSIHWDRSFNAKCMDGSFV